MPFFTEWMKERSQVMLQNEENGNRKESSLNKTQQLQSQNDKTQEQGAKHTITTNDSHLNLLAH